MNPTAETLELLKSAKVLDAAEMAKAGITIAQGLVAYDLEPAAKKLYPLITPLRNSIARVGGGVGTAVHWLSVTGINVARLSPGVSEGKRGGAVSLNTTSNMAAYKTLGHEIVRDLRGRRGQPPRHRQPGPGDPHHPAIPHAVRGIGPPGRQRRPGPGANPHPDPGRCSSPGAPWPPTPPLRWSAWPSPWKATWPPRCPAAFINITRNNADGSTDTYGGGAAQASAPASITTANDGNATHGLKASVAPVNGAMAYAWFWGPAAGPQLLGAITTINSVLILAAATGTQTAASLPAATTASTPCCSTA